MKRLTFTSSSLKGTLFAFLVSLLTATVAVGQTFTEQSPQRGLAANSSFALSDIETINLDNGNLLYKLPIASLPAGRAGLAPTVYLNYNSKLYDAGVGRVTRPCDSGPTFEAGSEPSP